MGRLDIIDLKNSWYVKGVILSHFLKEYFSDKKDKVNILEAGCGRNWDLYLDGMDYMLTGVDIDEEAVKIRKYKQQDLDEIIIGNLQTIELTHDKYDVVYCSNVLEHINGAKEVLDKLFRWIKPKGVLVLLIPDRNTVYGFLTRVTPFWFHLFYYKYYLKNPNAGKVGQPPYPVFFDYIVSRNGIFNYCRKHGYKIHIEYGDKSPHTTIANSIPLFFNLFSKLLEIISFGKLKSNHASLMYVIEKSP